MTEKYILNGNYSISMSGTYEVGGATFDYRRIDGLLNTTSQANQSRDMVTEWITGLGPLAEPVELMVNISLQYMATC